MPPPMHFSEHSSEMTRELGNRLVAQFKLAEFMGVPEEKIGDWCDKYAKLFGEIEHDNPELSARIKTGTLTDADLVFVKDQMGEYDTGIESYETEREIDA